MPGIALNGTNGHRPSNYPVFVIRVNGVGDKQQRGNPKTMKLKVHFDCGYMLSEKERNFVETLKIFIAETFEKYSYFHKKNTDYVNPKWYSYDFFILTADIPNIMIDLENEFEIYMSSTTYNL